MSVFSNRHRRALAEGKLVVEFDDRARVRVWRLMSRHNGSLRIQRDPNDGWTDETDYLTEVGDELLDAWGESSFPGATDLSFPSAIAPKDPEGFVMNGPGVALLDTIELFVGYLSGSERSGFRAKLNELLAEEGATWRMLETEMVQLDSVFVHEQGVARAMEMTTQHGYEGAADEMRRSQHDLLDGDNRGAVHNAGSSFESTAKAVLGISHGTARELITRLKDDGYFNGLPKEHTDGFLTNVLGSVPWLRNRLGGHGQGRQMVELTAPYARLALNLAAALNQFLIELKLERDAEPVPPPEQPTHSGDFSAAGAISGSDDDIPF